MDLFNLTLKCLGHIVYMYVCDVNSNLEQDTLVNQMIVLKYFGTICKRVKAFIVP